MVLCSTKEPQDQTVKFKRYILKLLSFRIIFIISHYLRHSLQIYCQTNEKHSYVSASITLEVNSADFRNSMVQYSIVQKNDTTHLHSIKYDFIHFLINHPYKIGILHFFITSIKSHLLITGMKSQNRREPKKDQNLLINSLKWSCRSVKSLICKVQLSVDVGWCETVVYDNSGKWCNILPFSLTDGDKLTNQSLKAQ